MRKKAVGEIIGHFLYGVENLGSGGVCRKIPGLGPDDGDVDIGVYQGSQGERDMLSRIHPGFSDVSLTTEVVPSICNIHCNSARWLKLQRQRICDNKSETLIN